MLGISKHPKAEQGNLVLLLIRTLNIPQVIEGLSPEEAVRLLNDNATICENTVKKSGGALVGVNGHCILAAWNETDQRNHVDYCHIAHSLIHELQVATRKYLSKQSIPASISVSVTKGPCVFERQGSEYTHVFGGTINRVEQIANKYSQHEGSVILVDDALKDMLQDCLSEDIGDGVRKINVELTTFGG